MLEVRTCARARKRGLSFPELADIARHCGLAAPGYAR